MRVLPAVGGNKNVLIFRGLNYRPIALTAPLRSVFAKLLDDRTQLFAGRDAYLADLERFIRDPAGGYLMVTAPPGFGKTALMARLAQAVPDIVAYHFFAPQFAQDSMREA